MPVHQLFYGAWGGTELTEKNIKSDFARDPLGTKFHFICVNILENTCFTDKLKKKNWRNGAQVRFTRMF